MLKSKKINDFIVFTDLDGTLLDHHTYSFSDAKFMLNYLKQNHIPLIIVTSKTKPEVIELQKKLEIQYPFIVENGAGIYIPNNENLDVIDLGYTYEQTLKAFKTYSKKIDMKGFHQMSVEEVANETQLSLNNAIMAKQRCYSEPFILKDESQLDQLKHMAQNDNFDIVKGGRFYHLITMGQDKSNAIKKLVSLYNEQFNKEFHTIALGDGENDLTMLNSVEYPVLIPKSDMTYVSCNNEKVIYANYPGPKGWNETLKRIFNA